MKRSRIDVDALGDAFPPDHLRADEASAAVVDDAREYASAAGVVACARVRFVFG